MTDEDRGLEAAAHLQRAALEFIEAARILLDVAEEAVREPGGLASIISDTLGGLVSAAGAFGERGASDAPAEPDDARDAPPTSGKRTGVQHIRVS